MMVSVDTYIYKGTKDSVNKNLLVSYNYSYEIDGDFQTAKKKRNNMGYVISPSFSISISEAYDGKRLFIPNNKYFAFVTLLEKAVNLISENLYTIFPDVNKMEFDIDTKTLERFQTEKALTNANMTAMPAVWVNSTNECYPSIKITSATNGSVTIPLEDAIPMTEMFKRFDPLTYSISMLQFFGKLD